MNQCHSVHQKFHMDFHGENPSLEALTIEGTLIMTNFSL